LTTYILAFAVFLAAIGGMAAGVLLTGRRIQGSCGGLANIEGVGSDCGGACRKPCKKRLEAQRRAARQGT
jgi:hypothetical protein